MKIKNTTTSRLLAPPIKPFYAHRRIAYLFKRGIKHGFLLLCFYMGASYAYSQSSDLDDFTETMRTFFRSASLASSLSMLGSTDTSSGYVGDYPHFSIGFTMSPSASGLDTYFEENGDLDKTLANAGDDPFPGFAFTTNLYGRFGVPKFKKFPIPLDFAVFLGGFPEGIYGSGDDVLFPLPLQGLQSLNISVSAINLALEARTPVFYEQRFIPGLTASLLYGYNHLTTGLNLPLDSSDLKVGDYTVDIKNPRVKGYISSHTVGLKLQTQKNLWFIEPYFGVQPFITFTSGGISIPTTEIEITDPVTGKSVNINDVPEFRALLDKLDDSPILKSLTEEGIGIIENNINGGLRFSGGFSLRVWKMYLDMGGSGDPFTKSLTGTIALRINF